MSHPERRIGRRTRRAPLGPPLHGESGESAGSLIRSPTVALLPTGERTVAQPARPCAWTHAREQHQRKGTIMDIGKIIRVLENVPASHPAERTPPRPPLKQPARPARREKKEVTR